MEQSNVYLLLIIALFWLTKLEFSKLKNLFIFPFNNTRLTFVNLCRVRTIINTMLAWKFSDALVICFNKLKHKYLHHSDNVVDTTHSWTPNKPDI